MRPSVALMRIAHAAGAGTTYATWGTTNKSSAIGLSSGDLIATLASKVSYYNSVRGNIALTGKKYWEVTFSRVITVAGDSCAVGIGTSVAPPATGAAATTNYLGGTGVSVGVWDDGSVVQTNIVVVSKALPAGPLTIAHAFDAATGQLWIGDGAGGWTRAGANPATGTSPTTSVSTGSVYYPVACATNNTQAFQINAGQSAFVFSVPSGYSAGIF